MPLYEFYNKETEQIEDHLVRIANLDEFVKANPHLEKRVSAVALVSGVQGIGRMKNDSGWRDNMQRIASHHPGSALADQYGSKSIKDAKTRQVMTKHKGSIRSD
jgi:hypothetical protein